MRLTHFHAVLSFASPCFLRRRRVAADSSLLCYALLFARRLGGRNSNWICTRISIARRLRIRAWLRIRILVRGSSRSRSCSSGRSQLIIIIIGIVSVRRPITKIQRIVNYLIVRFSGRLSSSTHAPSRGCGGWRSSTVLHCCSSKKTTKQRANRAKEKQSQQRSIRCCWLAGLAKRRSRSSSRSRARRRSGIQFNLASSRSKKRRSRSTAAAAAAARRSARIWLTNTGSRCHICLFVRLVGSVTASCKQQARATNVERRKTRVRLAIRIQAPPAVNSFNNCLIIDLSFFELIVI